MKTEFVDRQGVCFLSTVKIIRSLVRCRHAAEPEEESRDEREWRGEKHHDEFRRQTIESFPLVRGNSLNSALRCVSNR